MLVSRQAAETLWAGTCWWSCGARNKAVDWAGAGGAEARVAHAGSRGGGDATPARPWPTFQRVPALMIPSARCLASSARKASLRGVGVGGGRGHRVKRGSTWGETPTKLAPRIELHPSTAASPRPPPRPAPHRLSRSWRRRSSFSFSRSSRSLRSSSLHAASWAARGAAGRVWVQVARAARRGAREQRPDTSTAGSLRGASPMCSTRAPPGGPSLIPRANSTSNRPVKHICKQPPTGRAPQTPPGGPPCPAPRRRARLRGVGGSKCCVLGRWCTGGRARRPALGRARRAHARPRRPGHSQRPAPPAATPPPRLARAPASRSAALRQDVSNRTQEERASSSRSAPRFALVSALRRSFSCSGGRVGAGKGAGAVGRRAGRATRAGGTDGRAAAHKPPRLA